MGALRAALIAAAVLFACPMARAQEPASPERESEARRLYELGRSHYNLAEYDEAIAAFRSAYELRPAPELLYNLAQAYRLRGDCAQARDLFRAYVRESPEAANRVEVEGRIARLETCARERESTRAPPLEREPPRVVTPPRPPLAEPDEGNASWLPLTLGIGGLAVGLVGGVLYGLARVEFESLSDECLGRCDPGRATPWPAVETASYVVLAAGGAIVAAGLVGWLLDSGDDGAEAARTSPSVALVGSSVVLEVEL